MIPSITSFTPTAAAPGQKVTLTGVGFTGTTAVLFGGIAALFFRVVSDTSIEAWPTISGNGVITVTNPDGSGASPGFTLTQVKVKWPDLPPLERDLNDADLLAVWDSVRGILCKATGAEMPAGTGGGGTGGNIYTALGSPFKVRNFDGNYSYDAGSNSVTITDIRLIGKTDYPVFATDCGEFETYDAITNATGQLVYNSTDGSVQINDYKLTDKFHVTITADGVVSGVGDLGAKLALYDKLLAPITSTLAVQGKSGVVWPWRLPANLIPAGWQECTDFRGKTIIGQDPGDVYDSTTNPSGLSIAVNSSVGSKSLTIAKANLPAVGVKLKSNRANLTAGGSGTYVGITQEVGATVIFSENLGDGTPLIKLDPARIILYIEYIG